MPVYDQSYRTYQGTLRRRWRWAIVVGQEWRVLFSRRMFIFLMLLGNFHVVLRIVQIFILDVAARQGAGEMIGQISNAQLEEPGAWIFFDFLRMQTPLIFVTLIYAGSGLICNDFRNNLIEIYFSKPINWRDYVLGKVMALVSIGMTLTAAPALLFGLLHVLFNPSMDTVRDTLTYVLPIVTFSLLVVLSFTLVILASSALVESAKFAGAIVFMLALINITFGVLLLALMNEQNYLVVAFPVSLNNIGEALFQENRYENPITISWQWSAAYVVAVCLGALGFICQKARRAELGR